MSLNKELIDFIDRSPCSYFTVKNTKNLLDKVGFKEYKFSEKFSFKGGEKGYFIVNDSSIIAFNIGNENIEEGGFKVIASHSDSPGFRIKSKSPIVDKGIIKLNTEVYGGPIYSTWLDRVLSIAGRVIVRENNPFKPKTLLINIDRDLLTIPNLAIHMNREVNKGFAYDPQKHLLPIISLDKKGNEKFLLDLLAEELEINKEEILDCDLYLYDRQKSSLIGKNEEMISAGRQDNLSMVYTSLRAFIDTEPMGVNVLLITDNEEVGSNSIQGADSQIAENSFERIALALGKNKEDYLRAVENSFVISADMAHGLHPNFKETTDPTNIPLLGEGPVIKYSSNKAYTSDAYSASVFMELCKEAGVKFQTFYNLSGKTGGTTIGPITAKYFRARSVDVGNPLLAMHSVRELGSVKDNLSIYKVFKEFYKG
ncbi:M18 family aminopeptidase [Peptoniphilus catoniae]|uniref:M18 family aminopeptidase n=1 Tax=Peptoniphilus catoniae TaxID=1660341 RepID=UPI0010FEA70F|nr:M18 family aminopeptidase [Peptoniphilus catoniae]